MDLELVATAEALEVLGDDTGETVGIGSSGTEAATRSNDPSGLSRTTWPVWKRMTVAALLDDLLVVGGAAVGAARQPARS